MFRPSIFPHIVNSFTHSRCSGIAPVALASALLFIQSPHNEAANRADIGEDDDP
jgi:hypothetical protein